jgi:hypothetical protein
MAFFYALPARGLTERHKVGLACSDRVLLGPPQDQLLTSQFAWHVSIDIQISHFSRLLVSFVLRKGLFANHVEKAIT